MEKIAIIGAPGAGKSTLARQLGELLNIEVTHLDHYFWKPGWKKLSKNKRVQMLRKRTQKKAWIIEGCYHEALDTLLEAADTIIFLNMPRWLCLYRVIKRYLTERLRPDLPENSSDTLRFSYIKHIWQFPDTDYFYLHKKIGLAKNRKKVIKLSSGSDVSDFLEKYQTSCDAQTAQGIQASQTEQEVQLDWSLLMPVFFGGGRIIGCGL